MTFVTFVLMGVVLAVLFVAALFAVFLLNREDMRDSQRAAETGTGRYYGAGAQFAAVPGPGDGPAQQQGQYGQQQGQYGQQQGQYGQQQGEGWQPPSGR